MGSGPSLDSKSAGGMTLRDALLADNLLVVDVRGSEEAASGTRFPGSANIPVSDFQSRVDELGEKARPVVMHCRSGMRAGNCRDLAKQAGYVNVFSVANAEELLSLMGQVKPKS